MHRSITLHYKKHSYVLHRHNTTHHLQPQSMFMHVAEVEYCLRHHLLGGDLVLVDRHLVVNLSSQSVVVVVANLQPGCRVTLGSESTRPARSVCVGGGGARGVEQVSRNVRTANFIHLYI